MMKFILGLGIGICLTFLVFTTYLLAINNINGLSARTWGMILVGLELGLAVIGSCLVLYAWWHLR